MKTVGKILGWLVLVVLALALGATWGTALLGTGMTKVMGWLFVQTVPFLALPTVIGCVVVLIVRRRVTWPVLTALALGLVGSWPLLWSFQITTIRYPVDIAQMTPAATVRLPSNEQIRVAWGGDRLETNYHAMAADQRWAYDLVVEPAFHKSDQLEDYGCYGTAVVAPAAGKVIHAVDGLPDATPGKLSINIQNPTGNTVGLELDTGTFLVIAHLKPDSVAVAVDEVVVEGQVIGACGNSGNTSEPHIHIHHQRQTPAVMPTGLAEGLPLYFRDHNGKPMPEGGLKMKDEKVQMLGDVIRHTGATPTRETDPAPTAEADATPAPGANSTPSPEEPAAAP